MEVRHFNHKKAISISYSVLDLLSPRQHTTLFMEGIYSHMAGGGREVYFFNITPDVSPKCQTSLVEDRNLHQ